MNNINEFGNGLLNCLCATNQKGNCNCNCKNKENKMLKIELKEKPNNFKDLEVGTLFIWHKMNSWGDSLGMKISDLEEKEFKVLDLSFTNEGTGIYYEWDDNKFVIDRVINDIILKEV